MSDLISRQAAIDAILHITNCKSVRELFEYNQEHHLTEMWSGGVNDAIDAVIGVESATDNNVGTEHGTNLASLGTDCISRQAAIDALRDYLVKKRCPDDGTLTCRLIENEVINKLPPIQPDNGLQKLADEIATFKRCVKSENSDYLTGYLCALSVVEGMIANMKREVTT